MYSDNPSYTTQSLMLQVLKLKEDHSRELLSLSQEVEALQLQKSDADAAHKTLEVSNSIP